MNECKTVKTWEKTNVPNLVRHRSGTYYSRLFSGGKERWKSLGTTVKEVARNRLREAQREAATNGAPKTAQNGRMLLGASIATMVVEINEGTPLKARRDSRHNQESSREYRQETLEALKRSWEEVHGAELAKLEVRRVTKEQVEKWAKSYRREVSPSRFNNTLGTLRHLFDIAVAQGETYRNPAAGIERAGIKAKKLSLPEREMFPKFVGAIRNAGHRTSKDSADLVEFLAYTGGRLDEACHVTWGDVNFTRGTVHFSKTKNGEERTVPMIPEARALLERMRAERQEEPGTALVLKVNEARGSMTVAAEKVGMVRITHHDCRHLFATVAIESGVDIPTVSRWLGHKDGGQLAMKTYGHLRDEHSKAAAAKVSFAPASAAPNVIAFEQKTAVAV